MTNQQWQQLKQTIRQLTDAEKRELIDTLARSLNGGQNRDESEALTVSRQRAAWQRLHNKIRSHPTCPESDDGLVASRDHDKILYDGSSHTGFPEKPSK